MTEAIALREADAMPVWNPKQVVAQVNLIQEVMRDVMHKDEHYGTIPGTNKPTLLKPGAEKLCLTFRLAPTYDVIERDLGGGHREYRITCRLTSIQTGAVIGDGVGVCSTMESKYRYRHSEPEDTGVPIPGKYWEAKKAGKMEEALAVIGGKGFLPKKTAAGWTIHKQGAGRTENPDIADTYNTVLKMAKKRAMVDAAITATGASDIFTQDIEETAEAPKAPEAPQTSPEPPPPASLAPSESTIAPDQPSLPMSDLETAWVTAGELIEAKGWTKARVTKWAHDSMYKCETVKLPLEGVRALIMHLRSA